MTGAQITPMLRGGRYRVHCPAHQFDRTVETEAHATNLAALHDRKDHGDALAEATGIAHPETLDLSAAANYVLVCKADVDDAPDRGHAYASYAAALDLWEALVGLTGEPALTYAQSIRDAGATAAPIPF